MVRVVRGWGAIRTAKAATRNRGWFWLRSHRLLYKDQASGLRLRSTKITWVRFSGRTAKIAGVGVANGRRTTFLVTVVDRGRADVFRIRLGKSYVRGGKVVKGGVKILLVAGK
jgi:hypothetical protein